MNKKGCFLTITFLLSWICWLLAAFLIKFTGIQLFSPIGLPLYSLGAASPMISAWLVQKKMVTKEEFTQFKQSIFTVRQPITGYVLVGSLAWGFCFFPVLLGASEQTAPVYVALQQLPVMIFYGGGLEEVGWRGFLLPELQKKFSSFTATCLISVIWLLWHLPLWLVKGSGQDKMSVVVFALWLFSLAFLLTVIWNKYQSSLLCILLHAGFNSFTDVYPPNFSNLPVSSLLLLVCLGIYLLSQHFFLQKAG